MNLTLAQMKAAIRQNQLKNVGVQEAPGLRPKTYVAPQSQTYEPLPIGGVDLDQFQPGDQLAAPQQAQPQPQPPQPQGMAPDQPSNILQMTPQGQAMAAMRPPQQPQQPQPKAKGGRMEDEAAKAIGRAAKSAGMKAPVTAKKSLTTLDDAYQSLGDRIRQEAADRQNLMESMPFKYDKGHRVFTKWSAENRKPPYTVISRALYGNQPMKEDHPKLGPGYGKSIIDPQTGRARRTPYEPAYWVQNDQGEKMHLPESALLGSVDLAKGGQPKALHYAPGPVLKKADIEAHAERMARQIAGMDNPVGTTLKQLARQQALEVGIKKGGKKKDVPVIDYEKLKGAYSVGVPGDPSRGGLVPTKRGAKRMGIDAPKAGEYLESIGGEKLESPVPLYGGKDYGAYGHPEGWASDLGASAGMFNVVKRLAAENPESKILGHYHKMSPESLNHAVHMMDAVLSHHRPHQQPKKKIEELNRLMRDVATTKGKNDIPYPEFPGFENPADVMLMGAMNSGMRKKIISLLGTEKYFSGGKQKLEDLIFAVSHPELRNIEAGAGGSSILEFDPKRELREQISAHPTYGYDIPSKLIGKTKYITPAEILAPRSMANAVKEIKAMGKKVVPFNQAKMNIIREPIDEQYINQMGEYEQAMKKRLGYKKGGKVAGQNMDTMRLALTKKAK